MTSGAVPETLLERGLELQRLEALLCTVATERRGRFAAVVGPAGIGKTRLLQALRTVDVEQDVTLLAARGAELEVEFAYGVARQLLEADLRARRLSEQRRLFSGAAALAAAALGFDELATTAESQFAVVHGLYWLCAALAETSPLLLVVDDLHWADEPSIRFLAHLMRRVEDLPVLVVTATRPPLGDVRTQLIESIVADPDVERIDLTELSEGAVRALVAPLWGESPTERFVAALHRTTGGNPFLCTTFATALYEQGVPPDDASSNALSEYAGGSVAASVHRRLGRLPDEATELARALAIIGGPAAELRHAAYLAGLDPHTADRARDLLAAQGILESTNATEFVHPLVRTAIAEAMPRAVRNELHLEAARLLAREAVAPQQLAAHLMVTEPRSESFVVESLRRAAQAVLRQGEPRTAASYLSRALREPPAAGACAGVLQELGVAQFRAGDVDEAVRHLDGALGLETDPDRRRQIRRELGFAHFQAGRFAAAVDEQGRALAEAPAIDSDVSGWLEAERHQSAMMDPSLYRPLADGVELRPDLAGDRGGERAVLATRATEGSLRIEPGASMVAAWAHRAIERGLLEDSTSTSSGIWVNAAVPLIFAGDFDTAMVVADAMVDDAQRRGSPVAGARAAMVRSLLHLRCGSIRDAEADARWGCELGVEVGFPPARLAVGVLVEALVERRELDAAEAVLHDVGCAEAVPNRFVDNWILFARARLRRSQARVEEAAADLVELGRRGDHGWRPWNPAIFGWRSELALVALDAGDRNRATQLAARERELAGTWGAPFAVGIATRTLGRSVGDDHGWQLLADSVELLEGSGARLEHARSLVELGAALRRRGRVKESREPLAEGAELADSCGASALTDQALDELRATGARPRRTARSGVDALTSSELRVARRAAAGMTNRDIAQSLFVTVRTVEVHLTHCYQKLGISSRRELGAALGR